VFLADDGLHRMLMPALATPESAIEDWRSRTLPGPAPAQIDQVTLTREGSTIELDRHGEQWSLAAPQTGRADARAVQAILGAVTNLRVERFVDDQAKDLAPYGLAKPSVVLALRVASGAATAPATQPAAAPAVRTLRIGSSVDRYYATWSDGPADSRMVVEVPKDQLEAFNKSIDELRDPRITLLTAGDVRQIEVARGGQVTYHLVRDTAEGPWRFADPKPPFTADSAAVNELLTTLVEARSHAFVPAAKLGSTESATVTLTAQGASSPEVLHFYPPQGPDGQALVVRASETTAYRVDPQRLRALTGSPLALRDRQVWALKADQIKTLHIVQHDPVGGEVALTFERSFVAVPAASQPASAAATRPAATQPASKLALVPGPWKLEGSSEPFESLAVESLVAQLGNLHAARWLAAFMPPSGVTRIDIGTVDGASVLLIVDGPASRAWNAAGQCFELSTALADAASGEFRFRTVLPIASADIRKIALTTAAGTMNIERDDAGRYTCTDGGKIERAAAGGLFDTLGGLRVERFVAQIIPGPADRNSTSLRAIARPMTCNWPAPIPTPPRHAWLT
jgi:hypothetical protein